MQRFAFGAHCAADVPLAVHHPGEIVEGDRDIRVDVAEQLTLHRERLPGGRIRPLQIALELQHQREILQGYGDLFMFVAVQAAVHRHGFAQQLL